MSDIKERIESCIGALMNRYNLNLEEDNPERCSRIVARCMKEIERYKSEALKEELTNGENIGDVVMQMILRMAGNPGDDIDENDTVCYSNTIICYFHRDSGNFKSHGHVVVKGLPDEESAKKIMDSLIDGEYFIPACVGIPTLGSEGGDWHEFFSDFAPTKMKATEDMSFKEFAENFAKAKQNSWT